MVHILLDIHALKKSSFEDIIMIMQLHQFHNPFLDEHLLRCRVILGSTSVDFFANIKGEFDACRWNEYLATLQWLGFSWSLL